MQRGLDAISDVEVVPREHARRTIWIVTGATPAPLAASVIVTERYDRETLMVLGIEDDDMAERMMALQIVVDHQIFTGRDPRGPGKANRGVGERRYFRETADAEAETLKGEKAEETDGETGSHRGTEQRRRAERVRRTRALRRDRSPGGHA